MSADAIAHRVKQGWLTRMHRGVYLAGPLRTPHTEAMAAVLACGEGAVLSHVSAAVIWDLVAPQPGAIHVTVPRHAHSREGIRVHRSRLHPEDATRRHQIPVTSAARTLLDLAALLTPRELDRAINEAQVQRRVTVHSLNEQFSRYPNHRGTAALRNAINAEPRLTRSEAERRMLELIRGAGLPLPEANVRIAGYEVDCLWRARKLVVEVDGFTFHSSRSSFERDRRRDAVLAAGGWRVVRVTWTQIVEQPIALVATLATALAA